MTKLAALKELAVTMKSRARKWEKLTRSRKENAREEVAEYTGRYLETSETLAIIRAKIAELEAA